MMHSLMLVLRGDRRSTALWVTAGLLALSLIALASLAPALARQSSGEASPALLPGSPGVLTQHNDNARTGANLNETVLNTSNVSAGTFGKLFTRSVQGHVYAQPLYVPDLALPGQGTHNVVFVATMHNMVYAFDADDPLASTPLWSVNLGTSAPATDFGSRCNPYQDIAVEVGIVSTPVIDPTTNTIYVVALTKESGLYYHRLHALDLLTGAEKVGSPVQVQGSVPGGTGTLTFSSATQLQRSSLLLSNGVVYFSFAGYCDQQPYYGWIFGYNAATLQRAAIYASSANANASGIWQGGQGLSADSNSNLYVITGNGQFDANTGGPDLGDSIVQLSLSGGSLGVVDWFTPYNQANLNQNDTDLGSAGSILIPGTNLVVGGGKQGKLYVLDRSNMGHYNGVDDSQIVQSFQATTGRIFTSPVFWNGPSGPLLYNWSGTDRLKAYRYNTVTGLFNTTPAATGVITIASSMPGAVMSISSNAALTGTGILWASHPTVKNANHAVVTGTLRALDASNPAVELWNSRINIARDDLGDFAKFTAPTVANGKVYVATFSQQLIVYGLLATNTPTPTRTSTPSTTPTVLTRTPSVTQTPTLTRTSTTTPSMTHTHTPTHTYTATSTTTLTPTNTPTNTPTDTPAATATNTPTNTPTDTPILVGHVVWQGPPPQPDDRQMLPVTLTLSSGTTVVEFPPQETDASGFFTITLDGLQPGTYNWAVKGPKYLAICGTAQLDVQTSIDVGLLQAGDLDPSHDNVVNASDFNVLKSVYGQPSSLGDLDNDAYTSASDFNLLKANFGLVGCFP